MTQQRTSDAHHTARGKIAYTRTFLLARLARPYRAEYKSRAELGYSPPDRQYDSQFDAAVAIELWLDDNRLNFPNEELEKKLQLLQVHTSKSVCSFPFMSVYRLSMVFATRATRADLRWTVGIGMSVPEG